MPDIRTLNDISGVSGDFLVEGELLTGAGVAQKSVTEHVNDTLLHLPPLVGTSNGQVPTIMGNTVSWQDQQGGSGTGGGGNFTDMESAITQIKALAVSSWTLTDLDMFEDVFGINLIYRAAKTQNRIIIGGQFGKISYGTGVISDGPGAFTTSTPLGSESILAIARGFNAAGQEMLIAINRNGYSVSMNEGTSWSGLTPLGNELLDVMWGGGLWLIVDSDGKIFHSEWSGSTLSFVPQESDETITRGVRRLAFMEEIWVGVGDNNKIVRSADGSNWLFQVSGCPSDTIFNDVCAGNGVFIAVGTNGQCTQARPSGPWVKQITGTTTNLTSVAFNGGFSVIGGENGYLSTRIDNETAWTQRAIPTQSRIADIIEYNNLFWLFTDAGQIIVSASLEVVVANVNIFNVSGGQEVWEFRRISTPIFQGTFPNLSMLLDGDTGFGKYFLGGAAGIGYSTDTDLTSWAAQSTPLSGTIAGIASGYDDLNVPITIAVNTDNTLSATRNGTTWSSPYSFGAGIDIEGVVYSSGMFLVYDSNGVVFRSQFNSGVLSWQQQDSSPNITEHINGMAGGNGLFAGACNRNRIVRSMDGSHFDFVSLGSETIDLLCMGFGLGLFFVGSSNGNLFSSSNAQSFANLGKPFGNDVAITGAGFNSLYNTYIITNADGRIATSKDLQSWIKYPSVSNFAIRAIIDTGEEFVLGNDNGEVIVSRRIVRDIPDGWEQVSGNESFLGRLAAKASDGSWTVSKSSWVGGGQTLVDDISPVWILNEPSVGNQVGQLAIVTQQYGLWLGAIIGAGGASGLVAPLISGIQTNVQGMSVNLGIDVQGSQPMTVTPNFGG